MNNFFGWFVLAFYIIPLILVIPIIKKRRHIISGLLDRQAIKRNGIVKKVLGIPYYLQFQFDEKPITITLSHGGKNSPPTTSLMADINLLNKFHMSVGKEYYFSKLGKKLGSQDIQVMNPEFDDAFIIKGSDESRVRSFLEHDIQNIILGWKESTPHFTIANNKICFSINKLLKEDESLDEFIEGALKLVQKSQQLG